MKTKMTAAVLIVGISLLLFMGSRTNSRADAASSSCLSDAPGPSQPMICN